MFSAWNILCSEHSLAHSFTPFRSFPHDTSMGTPPSILIKTSTAQPFSLHLHPYHSHCHYLCVFLIHNSSFLSGYQQYNLHESWSFALFTHQFLESGPRWAQLTDFMNKSHVLLGEECFNDRQMFLKNLLLFLASYFVLFHSELVLVVLTMPQVFQVDLFCVLL